MYAIETLKTKFEKKIMCKNHKSEKKKKKVICQIFLKNEEQKNPCMA